MLNLGESWRKEGEMVVAEVEGGEVGGVLTDVQTVVTGQTQPAHCPPSQLLA